MVLFSYSFPCALNVNGAKESVSATVIGLQKWNTHSEIPATANPIIIPHGIRDNISFFLLFLKLIRDAINAAIIVSINRTPPTIPWSYATCKNVLWA